ncbi:MAG: hypothetical protein HUK24_01615, partial [Sphaerochaetaceae bacterium]|nr:hypothetical protein [Sphaerochaetaceae bacterium]
MVIDFHTHAFPETLAPRAMEVLARNAKLTPFYEGTVRSLKETMVKSNTNYSLVLPISTKPSSTRNINNFAIELNSSGFNNGIFSFGTVHPDNENYKEELMYLKDHGIKGIKLHPAYQSVPFDDIRCIRIVAFACEIGLYTIIHGGYDQGVPS